MSQVNVPFLIAGGLVAAVGILVWALKKGGRWAAPVAVGAGVVVLALGFIIPPGVGGSDAAVSIVTPDNGEQVWADRVRIKVAVQNGTIATSPQDTEGGHLHLYVDGQLQQMPYADQVDITMTPGTHRLRVEYVDNRHIPFDPPVDATVTVEAVPQGGEPA